jgi:hypothetical protein
MQKKILILNIFLFSALAILIVWVILPDAKVEEKYDEIKADSSESMPNIIISSPMNGKKTKSPILLQGEARNNFEGEVNFRLKEKEGKILIEDFLTLSGADFGEFGTFKKYLIFSKPETEEGILEIFYISPKDGSEQEKESVVVKFELEEQWLEVQIQREGDGEGVKNGDNLVVDYIGLLKNGTKFDSSYDRGEPFEFILGVGKVIKGWDLGILGMKKGERRKIVIPPELGYGETGVPNSPILPDTILIFEVEILKINNN